MLSFKFTKIKKLFKFHKEPLKNLVKTTNVDFIPSRKTTYRLNNSNVNFTPTS